MGGKRESKMLALAAGRQLQRGVIIDGKPLQGKRQPSVVIATGRKGDKGAPIEKDRFRLAEVNENKQKIRPDHAAFFAFNKAPMEKRRVLYGIITHISEEDALWYERSAQQLRVDFYKSIGWFKNGRDNQQTVAHPNRLRACHGGGPDGKAIRWFGPGPDDFRTIECPGDRCEFSKKLSGEKKAPCGLSMDFMFQLMWKDEFAGLPSVTARYVSHGMGTLRNFIGFFEEISTAINVLGIKNPVLYGFPFMMSLGEKTKPSENWIWPTVTITPMMSPLDFFYAQTERRKQLKEMAAQIPAVVTIREEMEIRPTVYLMDEAGPLHIGKQSQNGTSVVTVEPEIVTDGKTVENRSTMPVGEGDENAPTTSKNDSASQKVAILSGIKGENGHAALFPENWATEREKKIKNIGKWRDIAAETLGNNLLLKTKTDKESAWELYWRITAARPAFEKIDAIDVWNSLTYDGDLQSIPLVPMKGDDEKTCLAGVVAKLEAKYRELKAQRKAA